MNFPNELINIIFSYSKSETADLIKNFVKKVEENYSEESGSEFRLDDDLYFAIWANGESSGMTRRFCVCDLGILREGAIH